MLIVEGQIYEKNYFMKLLNRTRKSLINAALFFSHMKKIKRLPKSFIFKGLIFFKRISFYAFLKSKL